MKRSRAATFVLPYARRDAPFAARSRAIYHAKLYTHARTRARDISRASRARRAITLARTGALYRDKAMPPMMDG